MSACYRQVMRAGGQCGSCGRVMAFIRRGVCWRCWRSLPPAADIRPERAPGSNGLRPLPQADPGPTEAGKHSEEQLAVMAARAALRISTSNPLDNPHVDVLWARENPEADPEANARRCARWRARIAGTTPM